MTIVRNWMEGGERGYVHMCSWFLTMVTSYSSNFHPFSSQVSVSKHIMIILKIYNAHRTAGGEFTSSNGPNSGLMVLPKIIRVFQKNLGEAREDLRILKGEEWGKH